MDFTKLFFIQPLFSRSINIKSGSEVTIEFFLGRIVASEDCIGTLK